MLVQRKSISAKLLSFLVFLQAALIVTGGSVRLTGSGLGCPTWPECTPGSYTPIPNQAEGQLHAWIEFGNRLLTFVLFFCAVAVVIIAFRVSSNAVNKSRIRSLAGLQVLGILGQGVLGGITVLTDLHPLSVASHYMLSIFLIAGAISLRYELLDLVKKPIEGLVGFLFPIIIWLTLIILAIGTVVTGSGPHAGDENAQRFGFELRTVASLHADFVIAVLVLTIVLLAIAHHEKLSFLSRRLRIFLLILLCQGLIGYVQYFQDLPELLVAFHLIGSTLVWGYAWGMAKSLESGFKLRKLS